MSDSPYKLSLCDSDDPNMTVYSVQTPLGKRFDAVQIHRVGDPAQTEWLWPDRVPLGKYRKRRLGQLSGRCGDRGAPAGSMTGSIAQAAGKNQTIRMIHRLRRFSQIANGRSPFSQSAFILKICGYFSLRSPLRASFRRGAALFLNVEIYGILWKNPGNIWAIADASSPRIFWSAVTRHRFRTC